MIAHPRGEQLYRALSIIALEQNDCAENPTVENLYDLVGADPTTEQLWLCLYILRGALPNRDELVAAQNEVELLSAPIYLEQLLVAPLSNPQLHVEVISDTVLVDVCHTSRTPLATGIQRVVRETISRWRQRYDPTFVTWNDDYSFISPVSPQELSHALVGKESTLPKNSSQITQDTMLVPVRCTYLIPELVTETERTCRLAALASHSGNKSGIIGYDCVPISSAETAVPGMPATFARNVEMAVSTTKIAAISNAAKAEYSGIALMMDERGAARPQIETIALASVITPSSIPPQSTLRRKFSLGTEPLIVAIGSREPRKNHLAILRVAERAWLSGLSFQLVFVGGSSWASERFDTRIAELVHGGRPVRVLTQVSNDEIYGLLELAVFSIFPSWNEGFGLPISESLQCGTPVITSGFGSMKEVSAGLGVVYVDPRDDDEIFAAFTRLLNDITFASKKRREATSFIPKNWDQYAEELWGFFMSRA